MSSAEGSISAGRVKICLRQRPFIESEGDYDQRKVSVKVDSASGYAECLNAADPFDKATPFNFDHVYDQSSTTHDVFKKTVNPLISQAFRGGHSTVATYGARNSGRTHTIQGLLVKSFERMMALVDRFKRSNRYHIYVSYLQVYQSDIYDLLGPIKDDVLPRMKLRKDSASDNFNVQDQTKKSISSFHDFERLFKQASKRRQAANAGTLM